MVCEWYVYHLQCSILWIWSILVLKDCWDKVFLDWGQKRPRKKQVEVLKVPKPVEYQQNLESIRGPPIRICVNKIEKGLTGTIVK